MGVSSVEWLCFFIAVEQRGSSLAAHLNISSAKGHRVYHRLAFRKPIWEPVEQGSRGPHLSSRTTLCEIVPLPLIDVRSSGAGGIRATPTTCRYAGVLAKDLVQPDRCAEVSVMEGKIGHPNQVSLVT